MLILVSERGLEQEAEGVRSYVERRLLFALGRFASRVQRVRVACSDVNGPKGGSDKRCRVSVTIPSAPPIVVSDVATDLHVAVDRAADRVSRAVARRLNRMRQAAS
ncbi:MAG: HPF/RaiA family ribosome-associated protein [Planctomycetota bacterium]|jgi:ribosome-associated translation inhibitor RaiA